MRDGGRRAGVVYLIYFVIAMLGEGFLGSGHAAIGTAIEIASYLWYVFLTFVLCRLFLSVNKQIAGAAALVSWIGCIVGILRMLHAPTGAIDPLLFFGVFCILLGYLVFASQLLPRALGVLLALAGAGWVVFSVFHITAVAPYVEGLGIVAELALMLWLLVFGLRRSLTA